MKRNISEISQRYTALDEAYKTLLAEEVPGAEQSDAEPDVLARIAQKLADLQSHIQSATAQGESNSAPPDGDAQKRAQGRVGRLQQMQSALADMMASLKSAR